MKSLHAIVFAWVAAVALLSWTPSLHATTASYRFVIVAPPSAGTRPATTVGAASDVPVLSRVHGAKIAADDKRRRRHPRRNGFLKLVLLILLVVVLVLLMAILSKAITTCVMESILARYERERGNDAHRPRPHRDPPGAGGEDAEKSGEAPNDDHRDGPNMEELDEQKKGPRGPKR